MQKLAAQLVLDKGGTLGSVNLAEAIASIPLPADPASGEGNVMTPKQRLEQNRLALSVRMAMPPGILPLPADPASSEVAAGKYAMSEEWCRKMAALEDGQETLRAALDTKAHHLAITELNEKTCLREIDRLEAVEKTLRAALENASIYIERARLNLSYAKQDAVSSAAEAESNKNAAFHDCVAALLILKAPAP